VRHGGEGERERGREGEMKTQKLNRVYSVKTLCNSVVKKNPLITEIINSKKTI
jgi:hypothetical protein